MEKINKKKVSQLPEATSINGFYAFGTDNNNNSVKVSIDLLKGNKGDTGEKGDEGQKGEDGNNLAYKTIFNISAYNKKYDYTDATTARNAVPETLRELGQIVTYKLANGKWVTEAYQGTDLTGWAIDTNWKTVGINKKDLSEVKGIEYEKTTNDSYVNILSFENEEHGMQNNGVNRVANASVKSSPDYFPIEPNTEYFTNCNLSGVGLIIYDEYKKVLNNISKQSKFATAAKARYARYNQYINYGGETYIYKANTTTLTDNLCVSLTVGDIVGAKEVTVNTEPINIIPKDIETISYGLDDKHNASNGQCRHSSYVVVEPSTEYLTNLVGMSNPTIFYYDQMYRPITYISVGYNKPVESFITPVNCRYIRFNVLIADIASSSYYITKKDNSTYFTIPNLVISPSKVLDLDGEVKGVKKEAIPYNSLATTSNGSRWGYIDQSAFIDQYIDYVIVKCVAGASVTIGFSDEQGGIGAVSWSTSIIAVEGENTIPVKRKMKNSEHFFVQGNLYLKGTANPVGGGIMGANGATIGSADLSVGIFIIETGSTNLYYALGDSITMGSGARIPYPMVLASRFNASLTNIAVHGNKVLDVATGQIPKVPIGYSGIITVLIGINDASKGTVLGDTDAVMAKNYDALVAGASFSESYRYVMETLQRNCPEATICGINILFSSHGQSTIENYRTVISKICEKLSIPLFNIHKTAGLVPNNYTLFMPDGLHPNDAGHKRLARALANEMFGYFVEK